jgi:hypothetical protein
LLSNIYTSQHNEGDHQKHLHSQDRSKNTEIGKIGKKFDLKVRTMKDTIPLAAEAAGISAANLDAANTYWQVYCVSEGRVITNTLTRAEADSAGSRHSLDTGHTTQTSEHQRGQ